MRLDKIELFNLVARKYPDALFSMEDGRITNWRSTSLQPKLDKLIKDEKTQRKIDRECLLKKFDGLGITVDDLKTLFRLFDEEDFV